MNRYQLRILWLAIGLGTLMLAFPPWRRAARVGYSFFTDTPPRAEIDSGRLFVQLGIIALLAVGAWVTAKDARKQIPGRKDALGLLGYVSLVVTVGCAGMLLIAWNSERGISAAVAVPLLCIGGMAFGVFLMTATHYFDSLKGK